MNVSELPLELIDEILKRLDAISLAKSRQVCRSWRTLHSQPKYKLVWRSACYRDIGVDVLIELTNGTTAVVRDQAPGTLRSTDTIDWEAIYQEWYRSRYIGKWPSMVTELEGHRGEMDFQHVLLNPFGCGRWVSLQNRRYFFLRFSGERR